VHLGAAAADSGSGIASVRFEQRPSGGGAFASIGTDSTAPYEASWDATGLDGGYELRAIATDAAGNPATAATITVSVDSGAASVTLADPGSLLRGVVDLTASAPSLAVTSVDFERRTAGGTWTRIVLDATRPWGATLDTKSLGDGVYDLRATALGSSGQVLATHSRDGIRIDNTAPTMVSATPAEGSTVSSAKSIALVASEPVASVRDAKLDGSAAAATISGANVTFATASLGAGLHSLTGTLVDAAGNTGAFSLGFTVEVEAHAALLLEVNKPITRTKSRGSKRLFLVGLSLSRPARVRATLVSPSGRRLRTLRVSLGAGRHSLSFLLPSASLPPGTYTVAVVATASDGSKVVKRVKIGVPATHAPAVKPAVAGAGAKNVAPSPVLPAPVAQPSEPVSPAAAPPTQKEPSTKPEARKQEKPAKTRPLQPLETGSGYVGSRSHRTMGLLVVLLGMGIALGLLIKIEMGRMLASPRR
jgi:methionine-rich copper-binding protein CopC